MEIRRASLPPGWSERSRSREEWLPRPNCSVRPTPSVILSPSPCLVILSAAKDLLSLLRDGLSAQDRLREGSAPAPPPLAAQILRRCVPQDDKPGFIPSGPGTGAVPRP